MPCTGLPLGCSILLPALYTPLPSAGPHPKSPGSVRQPWYPQGHPVFAVGSFAAADSHGPCFLRESREDSAGDRGSQQPRAQADADRVQIPALQVAPPGLISPSRKHLSRGAAAKSSPGQALAHTQTHTHTPCTAGCTATWNCRDMEEAGTWTSQQGDCTLSGGSRLEAGVPSSLPCDGYLSWNNSYTET